LPGRAEYLNRAILRYMDFKQAADKLRKRGHRIFSVVGNKAFVARVDDTYNYTAEQLIFLVENGLNPGTIIWSRVVLNSDLPDVQANEVMSYVAKEYQAARLPDGVEIYRAPATGGHVFYFSPQAAVLLPSGVSTTPCVKPDVSNMKRQTL
jgi:hypothetical protein